MPSKAPHLWATTNLMLLTQRVVFFFTRSGVPELNHMTGQVITPV